MAVVLLVAVLSFQPSFAADSDCIKDDKKVEICLSTSGQLRAKGDLAGAYKALKQYCDVAFEPDCSGLLYDSLRLSSEIQKETVELFKTKCKEKDSYCDMLGLYYKEIKDHKNALLYFKKYFQATKKGEYPQYEYHHGSKDEAFKAALTACEASKDKKYESCVFYVRYMPDHSDYGKLLSLSEENCRQDNSSTGATACAILGTYYFKKDQSMQAFNLLSLDCQRGNASSCFLILGSDKTSASQRQMTANKLCELTEKTPAYSDMQVLRKNCPLKDASEVPAELIEFGQESLHRYTEEQK